MAECRIIHNLETDTATVWLDKNQPYMVGDLPPGTEVKYSSETHKLVGFTFFEYSKIRHPKVRPPHPSTIKLTAIKVNSNLNELQQLIAEGGSGNQWDGHCGAGAPKRLSRKEREWALKKALKIVEDMILHGVGT